MGRLTLIECKSLEQACQELGVMLRCLKMARLHKYHCQLTLIGGRTYKVCITFDRDDARSLSYALRTVRRYATV